MWVVWEEGRQREICAQERDRERERERERECIAGAWETQSLSDEELVCVGCEHCAVCFDGRLVLRVGELLQAAHNA